MTKIHIVVYYQKRGISKLCHINRHIMNEICGISEARLVALILLDYSVLYSSVSVQ